MFLDIYSAGGGYIAVPSNDAENKQLATLASVSSFFTTWIGLNIAKTTATMYNEIQFDDGSFVYNRTFKTWKPISVEQQMYVLVTRHPYPELPLFSEQLAVFVRENVFCTFKCISKCILPSLNKSFSCFCVIETILRPGISTADT